MKRTTAGIIALVMAGLVAALVIGPPALAGAARPAGHAAWSGENRLRAPAGSVIVIGVAGLRWSDISAAATPAIWRLARTGSVGSLAVTTISKDTCPADAWLTLNSGARAAANPATGSCRPVPVTGGGSGTAPAPARVLGMATIKARNNGTGYGPAWGTLARAAGAGRCSTAVGPGAALALADRAGHVLRYLPAPPAGGDVPALLRQCPLSVIDLGALRQAGRPRALALAADDRLIAEIAAAAPAGSVLMLAGMGDDGTPRLRSIVVSGPGYRSGLLTSSSTRQPGIVTITDLTPSILRWLGEPVPAALAGAPVTAGGRGPLGGVVTTMIGQETADQVYKSIVGWFFLYYGIAEAVLFAAIAFALRGSDARQVRRRVAWYTVAGCFAAAVPGRHLPGRPAAVGAMAAPGPVALRARVCLGRDHRVARGHRAVAA